MNQATTTAVTMTLTATTTTVHMGQPGRATRSRGDGGPGRTEAGSRRSHGSDPHQCPYCELQFVLHQELQDHVRRDHPDETIVAETAQIVELPPYRT